VQVSAPLSQGLIVRLLFMCVQYFGFVLYRHVFRENFNTGVLNVSGIRDRGYVLVNGVR